MSQKPDDQSRVTIAECEREAIHRPDAIQPHACVLVLDAGSRSILRASANLPHYPGLALNDAIGRIADDILPTDLARFLKANGGAADGAPPTRVDLPLETGQVSFCLATASVFRTGPYLVLEVETHPEESADSANLFRALETFLSHLRPLPDGVPVLQEMVDEVARRTAYGHVMGYRFDKDWNGEVIAERRNEAATSYLGHCFPASDIPLQARALYRKNPVRHTPDVSYQRVPLLPAQASDNAADVDLTWCSSRSISPIHREYMTNMGVQSSLSLSIMIDGELWGMILAHHSGPLHISPLVRSYLEMMAQIGADALRVALQREVEADVDNIMEQVSTVLNALNVDHGGLLNAVQQHHELLGAFDAEAAVIQLHGQKVTLGRRCPANTLKLIEAQVADEAREGPVSSDDIGAKIPAFRDEALRGWLGGFLYARLGNGRNDAVLFLRAERVRSEVWAGNPNEPHLIETVDGLPRIHPRRSFEAWKRQVRGCSLPWRRGHQLAAERLMNGLARHLAGEVERLLRHRAYHDELTGLPNRALLNDRLDRVFRRARRRGGSFVILFLDLDGFKPINDTYGHEAGDRMLEMVTEQFDEVLREADTVARVGGDEFIFLLEDFESEAAARENAGTCVERVINELEALRFEQGDVRLSCSVGIAIYPQDGDDSDTLIHAADQAMYSRKGQPGSRYAFASDVC